MARNRFGSVSRRNDSVVKLVRRTVGNLGYVSLLDGTTLKGEWSGVEKHVCKEEIEAMVHHKIPKKNRKKLKSVDPFNKNHNSVLQNNARNKNLEPGNEEQPLTRRQKDIQEFLKEGTFQKKKRRRNTVRKEALKHGFKVPKTSDSRRLMYSVFKQTKEEVEGKMLLAKFGLAGRSSKEMKAEYEKLDEREQRRTKAKKTQSKKISKKLDGENKGVVEEKNEGNEEEKVNNGDTEGRKAVKRKHLLRRQRYEEKRRQKQLDEEEDKVLNAKDYVPFGARVDAPPDLSSLGLLESKNPIKTKTKSLLLTKKFDLDKLNSSPTTSGSIVNSIKRNRDLAEERKRVIESYRAMKRSKHEL
ncbi:unnamed protein product [Enterobius vermicularis]|uniref:Coiled-coil domain-containing protein 137 n=1 Tax=Enterobius vermicularis TaxID=51028 RepID=A0A0N4UV32_ENTVE|nr:unnamed protein product [Enterobius vermicularis]